MHQIYLDNAASTKIDSQVIELMHKLMQKHYGNPSSIHAYGRQSRVIVEDARIKIAALLKVSPAEIFFTSGGTEGINSIINGVLSTHNITKIITSPIEHLATLHSIEKYSKLNNIKIKLLSVDNKGNIDLNQLEEELKNTEDKSFVSLMHANNEIGTLLPIKKVGELCQKHNAIFLSDTVQTIGKFRNDFSVNHPHFAIGSSHKFHGPKGVGFIYVNGEQKISPFIIGGAQERNMRAGTENMFSIAGMAEALDIAYQTMDKTIEHFTKLKAHLISRVQNETNGITFNGETDGLPNLISIGIPKTPNNEMLLMRFDIAGIMVSGGSACSSGALKDSHVIKAIDKTNSIRAIRVSMSKFTTIKEINTFVDLLKTM